MGKASGAKVLNSGAVNGGIGSGIGD